MEFRDKHVSKMFVVKSLSARNVHRCDKVNQFLHGSPSLGGSIFWRVPVGCYLGIDMFINSSLSRINMASQKQTVKEIVCKAYPDQYLLMVGHGLIWWWFNVPGQQGQASVWVNLFRRLTQAGIVLILRWLVVQVDKARQLSGWISCVGRVNRVVSGR